MAGTHQVHSGKLISKEAHFFGFLLVLTVDNPTKQGDGMSVVEQQNTAGSGSGLKYPMEMTFKLMTLGQRIVATDATGEVIMFIKQKMFRLKEKVEVYDEPKDGNLIFTIEADRMVDFSANYSFVDAAGNDWGGVRRKGMRSIWSAHYEIMQDQQVDMVIAEESPMKKVIEGILGEIPVLGFVAAYFLNPSYLVTAPDGTPLLRLKKMPAFLEGKFVLEKLSAMPEDDELRSLLGLIMLVLLERHRG